MSVPCDRRLVDEKDLPAVLEGIRKLDPVEALECADRLSALAADPRLTPKKKEWTNAFAFAFRKHADGVDPAATLAFLDEAGIHRN